MGRLTRHAVGAAVVVVVVPAGLAGAQTAPVVATPTPRPARPVPSPTASPAGRTDRLQGLDDFSLPSSQPSPAMPATALPVPVPSVRATPVAPVTRAVPVPVAPSTPTPRPSSPRSSPPLSPPRPVASPRPLPIPTPIPRVTQPPTVTPVSHAPSGPSPAPRPAPVAAGPSRWWLAGLLGLAVTAAIAWTRRRRGGDENGPVATPDLPAVAAPPPPPAPRARIEIELLPRRGGLTLISLAFEGELAVRNRGDARAEQVAVEASLIPARSEQDDELGALFARPVVRPAAPPFALAPGEERRVRLVAAMPLAGVEPLTAGGRAMIVPVLAANVRYAGSEAAHERQTAASWIIGVARPGGGKLAPFWLDAPGLSDALAARPHALAIVL